MTRKRAKLETYFEYDEENFDGELTRERLVDLVYDNLNYDIVDHGVSVETIEDDADNQGD
jgi:hypothetical protein